MLMTALRALREEGLVYYEPYEFASLTERGTKNARSALRRHKILRNFFSSILHCIVSPAMQTEMTESVRNVSPS